MINLKNETFIKSNSSIQLEETTEPWANLPKCIEGNDSLLFIGVKNTGKSTLAEYLLNSNNN
jgi:polynucleotide 5'-kinase involved in rRNA processing